MKKEFIRQVVVFEDHFKEFRKTLGKETLKKMYQILTFIMMEEVIPVKFLRAIEGRKGLYELSKEAIFIAYSAVLIMAISSFYSMDSKRHLQNSRIERKR